VSTPKLLSVGWRLTIFLSAIGGGALVVALMGLLAGMVWYGVIGWLAAAVAAFVYAVKVLEINVQLVTMAAQLRELAGANALDGEDE
jgi:hypothetical protein